MENPKTILVVEDHAELRYNLCLALELAGYRILAAADGAEALAALRSQPVDLILADIVMPRVNGIQLFQRLSANPQWAAIPFIFLTGCTLDDEIRRGKELGVDDYLTKPIGTKDLLAAVRGKLRRAEQLARDGYEPKVPALALPHPHLWYSPRLFDGFLGADLRLD